MSPLRQVWHLAKRFFGVLRSRPLGPGDQDEVRQALSREEAALFWQQQFIDQRHAYDVARRVDQATGNADAKAAALLHDVGKSHSRLGPVARSMATLLAALRIPLPASWARYRAHGELGAQDLEAVGARPLAVAFAAGEATGDRYVWDALVAADNGTRLLPKPGIDAETGNTMPSEVQK